MESAPRSGRLRLAHDVVCQQRDGAVLLTVPSTGQLLLLNATAARLIETLRASATRQEIVDDFCARFDVERDRAELDVEIGLHDLAQEGLLDRAAL